MSSELLGPFLNQTCQIEKYDADADITYNDDRFLPPATVACRKEIHTKTTYNSNGDVSISTTRYFIGPDIPVEVWKDRIDGKVIQEVKEYVWLDGVIVGYEVYV